MINVYWLSFNPDTPSRGYWDMQLLEDFFSKDLWNYGLDFQHFDQTATVFPVGQNIVVIPPRYQNIYIAEINSFLNNFGRVTVLLTGDEEAEFMYKKLEHPNMRIFVMTPHFDVHKDVDGFLPNGYAKDCRQYFKKHDGTKSLSWFFSGQVTHKRRRDCIQALEKIEKPEGLVNGTKGFTQGYPHEQYYEHVAKSIVMPCPAGAVIPDSFRMYEALESGCVPLADAYSTKVKELGYWNSLFGQSDLPFPIIEDWKDVEGYIQYHNDVFPRTNNKVFAWWQQYKRNLGYELFETPEKPITVLIPTSPIKSHPDTSIIDETIKSVRERLPDSEIIIMFDGVREEQKNLDQNYQEYIRKMLWKCNFEYKNVLPVVFNEHMHQVGMTRHCLKMVKTKTILFVEHDTPLCEFIPFLELVENVNNGSANFIRLHHEALILPEHQHMMLDKEPKDMLGVPMLRTAQWSQRPHVASTEFYKDFLDAHFSKDAKSMIEDKMHGVVHDAFIRQGQAGWNKWKLWIYAPKGDMKRSTHTDGRGSESKFDMIF